MGHTHDHSREATGDLRLAFLLNLGFTLVAAIGGVWTNSVAILSDAVHDFGDSLSLGLAWHLDRYARRERNHRFSYGYRRFSLLGAVATTAALVVGSAFVLAEAIPRLLEPEPTDAVGMIGFAALGVAVNGVAAFRLRGRKSLNARVISWHLLEDVLGWGAVLVVAITLLFFDLPVLDPALSIAITVFVLYNVIRNLRDTTVLFLQGVPDDVDLKAIERRFGALNHVQSTHHTQVWSMDGAHHVLTTHLVVDAETTKDEVLSLRDDVRRLCEDHDFAHTTVEIEWGNESCRMSERQTWT